jgi:copper chaperone CopZ
METLKFKTNIKCAGCVAKVTPALDEYAGENAWEVDVTSPEKILTVNTENTTAETIISAVKAAGFSAEAI